MKSLKNQEVECTYGFNSLSLYKEFRYTVNNVFTMNLANLTLLFMTNVKTIGNNVNKALEAVEGYQDSSEQAILPPPLHHTMIYFYLMNSKNFSDFSLRKYPNCSSIFEEEKNLGLVSDQAFVENF